MEKMTAIEWFWIHLPEKISKEYFDLFEQAKAMEKEHHGKTWDKALDAYKGRGHLYVRAWSDFDEYYNETYENNK